MRLLVVADVPPDPNSGAAGTVFNTNRALRDLGHSVDEVWKDDLPHRRIRHGNLHSLLEQPRAYRQAVLQRVRDHHYDVVQISQPQGYLAAAALKRCRFPGLVINRSHGVELRVDEVVPEWHRRLGKRESRSGVATNVLRRLLARQWVGIRRSCDGVIVGCELDRACLLNKLAMPAFRVRAIAHGVSDEYLHASLSNPDSSRFSRLLHVGQFAFFKGSDLLIEIVNRVLTAMPHVTFTWVCSRAHHQEILARFDPEVSPRVELLDVMPTEHLVELYDRCGVFLFPSIFEGFGKAPFEAMARGLCVVASDEGGMHDWIRNGKDGWLCEVGDVGRFAGKVKEAIETSAESMAIGNSAQDRSRQLTWRRCAEQAVEFYESLMPDSPVEQALDRIGKG